MQRPDFWSFWYHNPNHDDDDDPDDCRCWFRSLEMMEAKPTCQRSPCLATGSRHLPRSYHTTILLLLLPHHARVESDLVAVASSGQEQPRPNASIHHPQPFPDWDQHNFYQMLSAKKTNCIYACFLGFWGEILLTLPQNQTLSALATKPVQ